MKKIKLNDIKIESFIIKLDNGQKETLQGAVASRVDPNVQNTLPGGVCSVQICPTEQPDTKHIVNSQCYICLLTKGQFSCP